MKKIPLIILMIATAVSITNSQNSASKNDISIDIQGGKHCSCWDWGGKLPVGSCIPGGFVCIDWSIVIPNTGHIDKLNINLTNMTATYKIHSSNYSELEKITFNNNVHNEFENSMVDTEILEYFGYTGDKHIRIKQGDYSYNLVGDYYEFTVDIEEIN